MLAVLLLASIAWGSTAEFTHHHSAGKQASGSISKATSTVPEATSDQVTASKTNGTSSNTRGGAECLICQLHQNLSTADIGQTPGNGPTETRALNTPLSAVVQLSEFAATGHGRAPPVIL